MWHARRMTDTCERWLTQGGMTDSCEGWLTHMWRMTDTHVKDDWQMEMVTHLGRVTHGREYDCSIPWAKLSIKSLNQESIQGSWTWSKQTGQVRYTIKIIYNINYTLYSIYIYTLYIQYTIICMHSQASLLQWWTNEPMNVLCKLSLHITGQQCWLGKKSKFVIDNNIDSKGLLNGNLLDLRQTETYLFNLKMYLGLGTYQWLQHSMDLKLYLGPIYDLR